MKVLSFVTVGLMVWAMLGNELDGEGDGAEGEGDGAIGTGASPTTDPALGALGLLHQQTLLGTF